MTIFVTMVVTFAQVLNLAVTMAVVVTVVVNFAGLLGLAVVMAIVVATIVTFALVLAESWIVVLAFMRRYPPVCYCVFIPVRSYTSAICLKRYADLPSGLAMDRISAWLSAFILICRFGVPPSTSSVAKFITRSIPCCSTS